MTSQRSKVLVGKAVQNGQKKETLGIFSMGTFFEAQITIRIALEINTNPSVVVVVVVSC